MHSLQVASFGMDRRMSENLQNGLEIEPFTAMAQFYMCTKFNSNALQTKKLNIFGHFSIDPISSSFYFWDHHI